MNLPGMQEEFLSAPRYYLTNPEKPTAKTAAFHRMKTKQHKPGVKNRRLPCRCLGTLLILRAMETSDGNDDVEKRE
jgi:hypothetical protein